MADTILTLDIFPPSARCAGCGQCCKNLPGSVYPSDTKGDMLTAVSGLLQTGRYAVDVWDGGPQGVDNPHCEDGPFLRPATKGKEGRRYDESWGGECTFLTESGCSLREADRPGGCRNLEPSEDGNCYDHCGQFGNDKERAAAAWWPFREILRAAVGD